MRWRAYYNACLHRGTQLRTGSGNVERAQVSVPRFHLAPRRNVRPHAVRVGLSPCEEREFLPSAGPQRRLGWLRLRHSRPPAGRARRLTSRSFPSTSGTGRWRNGSPPRTWSAAPLQLEGSPRGLHRVVPHGRGSIPAAEGRAATSRPSTTSIRRPHVNRMITLSVASGQHDGVWRQQIVDAMFMTRDDPMPRFPDGGTARELLAERKRRELERATGRDSAI